MSNRYHIMRTQPRAHTIGNVEYINEEWVFFDEESDEAFLLDDVAEDSFEILYNNHWLPARFYENHTLKIDNDVYRLQSGETIRVPKKLQYVYEEWIKELSDASFISLTEALGQLGYSLYDSIYCHNLLFFQVSNGPKQGVNFIIYDNEDIICSLHHHYIRESKVRKDIFIFTQANGTTLTVTT
jgi:hypothetical protein